VKNGGNISVDIIGEVNSSTNDLNQFPYKCQDHTYPDLSQMVLLVTGAGTRMRDVAHDVFNTMCMSRLSDEELVIIRLMTTCSILNSFQHQNYRRISLFIGPEKTWGSTESCSSHTP
jgi:hypothetical protein